MFDIRKIQEQTIFEAVKTKATTKRQARSFMVKINRKLKTTLLG